MTTMKLSNIKISEDFAKSTPKESKVNECRMYWNMGQEQDRYIVVNPDNVLLDGYIQYLVLKENDIDEAQVIIAVRTNKSWRRIQTDNDLVSIKTYRERKTTYIYGTHENDDKERVWRVPHSWWKGWKDTLNKGDKLLVNTKNGRKIISITRIKILDKCPTVLPVKTVIKRVVN
jgi:hypothetical protein